MFHRKQLIPSLIVTAGLAAAAAPVFAGQDLSQIIQQERTIAQIQAQKQLSKGGPGAAGPAGSVRAAKEGEAGTQLLLLKRFHPKNAYGY